MAENIQININAAIESAQAATTIGQLRRSLVELQDIAENNDLGAEAFRSLQTQIVSTNTDLANARDRIGDIQDKISTLQGTPIEKIRNSFGLLKQSIFDLDFDKAKIGIEGLASAFTPLGPDGLPLQGLAAMRGALTNVTGAATQLGSTLIRVGTTLLTNPIFLLAAVVAAITVGIVLLLNKLGLLQPILDAIGAAVEFVTDVFNNLTEAIGLNTAATDKALKKTLESEQEKRKSLEETFSTQEKIAKSVADLNSVEQLNVEKLTGIRVRSEEDIATTRLKALQQIKDSYKAELAAFDEVQKTKRKLTEEEKKQYDDIVKKVEETNQRIIDSTAERVRVVNDELQNIRIRSIQAEGDTYAAAQKLRDEEIKLSEAEFDRRAVLLTTNKELIIQANKSRLFNNKETYKSLLQQIELNEKEIKVITDKSAIDKFDAEKKYRTSVNQLNNNAAQQQKERESKTLSDTKDRINDQILAEQNRLTVLLLNDKITKDVLLKAQLDFFNFEQKKKLEILELDKATEAEKEKLKLDTIKKIQDAQNKFNQEELTKEQKLLQLKERIAEFELVKNQNNILFIQAALKAKLSQIELEREGLTDAEKIQTLNENEFAIKQKLATITEEVLAKEVDNQKTLLETKLKAAQIIKDNNLKVDAETLASAALTQKLIDDVNTKGTSSLVTIGALTLQDKVANIEAEKTAKLELLEFNFNQEALKRAELNKTSGFINDLTKVDLELTKTFNAEKLAIVKAAGEEEVALKRLTEDDKFNIARKALTQITELTNLLFDFAINRAKKNAVDEEKLAKQKFQVNKALQVSLAIMDGYKAITSSLALSPVAFGPVPNPAGIASLSFAISTSLLNIGKILATQYKSSGSGGGGGSGGLSVPSANIGSASDASGQASNFTAPTFFGLGDERQQTTLGVNQQRVYVVESDITSVQGRVNVIENRAIIS